MDKIKDIVKNDRSFKYYYNTIYANIIHHAEKHMADDAAYKDFLLPLLMREITAFDLQYLRQVLQDYLNLYKYFDKE